MPEENVKVVNDGIGSILHATQEYCIALTEGYFAPISSPGKVSRARSNSSGNTISRTRSSSSEEITE